MSKTSKTHKQLRQVTKRGYTIDDAGIARKPDGSKQKVNYDRDGYARFTTVFSYGPRSIMVHQLAAFQRFGHRIFKAGIVVRHLNNDPKDNSRPNLAFGTQKQNSADRSTKSKKLTALRISKTMRAKGLEKYPLHLEQAIISDRNAGTSYRQLAVKFNLPRETVRYLIKRQLLRRAYPLARELPES